MSKALSFLPLNPREYLILFALVDGERHGYGIVKDVIAQTDGQVRMDPANLYRVIKRLIRDGLVVAAGKRPASESVRERRRYYAITKLGRDVVTAEAVRLDQLSEVARRTSVAVRTTRDGENGFVTNSSAPDSNPRSRSDSCPFAVRRMTWVAESSGSCLISRQTE